MMNLLMEWTKDESVHVRRLVSEGTRPRLPWAFQLKSFIVDPSEIFPLLTALKDDKELYVRRSVANNLNDISKDHPLRVIELLKQWKDGTTHMKWIIKHALRTLIKKGDRGALALLDYFPIDDLSVKLTLLRHQIYLGESLEFEVSIDSLSKEDQPLLIDFIVWYQKFNGSLTSKVFKLKQLTLHSQEHIFCKKNHTFSDLTTRKHYQGKHQIALQINGKVYEKVTFELLLK